MSEFAGVLHKYDDAGKAIFACTAEHAVDMAYLMSMADYYGAKHSNAMDLGEILADYASGDISVDEAIEQMEEHLDKPFQ